MKKKTEVLAPIDQRPMTDLERLVYSAFRLGVVKEVQELYSISQEDLARKVLAELGRLEALEASKADTKPLMYRP